jgi:hypothetical protein
MLLLQQLLVMALMMVNQCRQQSRLLAWVSR